MLSFYRRLIRLRQAEPALQIGSYAPVGLQGDILAFTREANGKRFLVALNLSHRPGFLTPERLDLRGRVVVGTHLEREARVELRGDEGVVIELS